MQNLTLSQFPKGTLVLKEVIHRAINSCSGCRGAFRPLGLINNFEYFNSFHLSEVGLQSLKFIDVDHLVSLAETGMYRLELTHALLE